MKMIGPELFRPPPSTPAPIFIPAARHTRDVSCGNGQFPTLLGEHFDRASATDTSPTRIPAATPHPRVSYLGPTR